MKCFVIMPFAKEFDDVYAIIKLHTESLSPTRELTCSRLDEQKPAGRITDRLLAALRECSFCIADLTGCNPNVMWEIGYAMALGKPLIIVTQNLSTLPFDVKDMQALAYDRGQLRATLGLPLHEVVRDTIKFTRLLPSEAPSTAQEDQARLVTGLGVQLAEVKEMVGQIVHAWGRKPNRSKALTDLPPEFRQLKGVWLNETSSSYVYISCVSGHLVAPYSYGGNDKLTAHYYDWRQLGSYFFARFKWFSGEISGFTFLRLTSKDVLQGAWWLDDEDTEPPTQPLVETGNSVLWRRIQATTPEWARAFVRSVRRGEIPA